MPALHRLPQKPKRHCLRKQGGGGLNRGKSSAYPKVYMACGEQDGLITVNRRLCDFLKQGGVDVTWRQAPGGHNWDFWLGQIRQVLDWLPLEQAVAGVNSGNVAE